MKRLIIFLIGLLSISAVLGIPTLPSGYWGYVKDSAGNLMDNVEVTIKDVTDVILASTITTDDGRYTIVVPWDDPDSDEREGLVSGTMLYFYVDSQFVVSYPVGPQGAEIRVDLSLGENEGDVQNEVTSGNGQISETHKEAEIIPVPETQESSDSKITIEDKPLTEAIDEAPIDEKNEKKSEQTENAPIVEDTSKVVAEEEETKTNLIFIILILFAVILIIFVYFKKRGAK
ncbi:MAG: carboxypeptidase-like regulatory domain-containing protein [Nanoarchaeota archaeon]|nr:carboxypeptidase-like regulatory domain-containing protein [Nanoarchaeota archaeon]